MAHPALRALKTIDFARLSAMPVVSKAVTQLVKTQSDLVARAAKLSNEEKPPIDFARYKAVLDVVNPTLVSTAEAEYKNFTIGAIPPLLSVEGDDAEAKVVEVAEHFKKQLDIINRQLETLKNVKPIEQVTVNDALDQDPEMYHKGLAAIREYIPGYMKSEQPDLPESAQEYGKSFFPKI